MKLLLKSRKRAVVPLKRKPAPKKVQRTYHKGNVSIDFLVVAARILKTERVEDISVRRLAREVGVTPANFYNHFHGLDELLLTLGAEGFDKIRHSSEQIIAGKRDRKEALLERCWIFIEFAMENKQIFRIMFGHFPNSIENERFRTASQASFGQLMHLIYGKDIYDPTDLANVHSRGRAAYAVFALVYGLARNLLEDQFQFETGSRAEIKLFVEDAVGALLDGTLVKELAS